jgi:FkbM family methyltransferase
MSLLTLDPRSWARSGWLATRLAVRLSNWRTVAPRFLAGIPLPELRLRNGVVLHHSRHDAPVFLLFEIFADGTYRRRWPYRAAGTVLDIGGNIGAAAIDFCQANRSIVVHSYEPNPASRETLLKNRDANRLGERIVVYPEAVGRCSGQMRLMTSGPSLAATAFAVAKITTEQDFVDVPMIGLEECLARVGARPVTLLKVDAEGAEADILENCPHQCFADILSVALEYHDDLVPQASERCLTVLNEVGYLTERCPARQSDRGMIYAWRKTNH